jgi:hypothetical protein
MPSRSGRSSSQGSIPRGETLPAGPVERPPGDQAAPRPGGGDPRPAPAADDALVVLPGPDGPGQPAPGGPESPGGGPESAGPAGPGPSPPPLPQRTRDGSRPSIPSKLGGRPAPARSTGAAEPNWRPPPLIPIGPGQPERLARASAPEPSRLPPLPGAPEAPARPPPPEPSWAAVLATTVRLWAGRRIRRVWPAQTRWRIVIMAALVAVVFVAGAVTVTLSRPGQRAAGHPGGGAPAGAGALAAAAAARQQAAGWVATQASADAIVACDPAMCTALQARGVPASRLLVLSPGGADPLGSDLVVATPAVRSEFGPRLAGVYAPAVLAVFGQGAAQIDVRAAAPDGAAAYRAQLATDVRARRADGRLLLHNRHIRVTAAAGTALARGEVDSRLLVTLATLADLHPLDITGFGAPAPGASAGVPLRTAYITAAPPPGARRPASLSRLSAVLRAQRPPYLPASVQTVQISPGRAVLKVTYPAPSPLGLLEPSS